MSIPAPGDWFHDDNGRETRVDNYKVETREIYYVAWKDQSVQYGNALRMDLDIWVEELAREGMKPGRWTPA